MTYLGNVMGRPHVNLVEFGTLNSTDRLSNFLTVDFGRKTAVNR